MVLLMMGGAVSEMWAAKVTYHILTLPIPNTAEDPTAYDYHMVSAATGKRLEAVKVVVDNQNTVELPAHYKSPLAENFTYYEPKDIDGHGAKAVSLYANGPTKGVLYEVKGGAKAVAEGTAITSNSPEYYVVYTYKTSNTIVQLDGSQKYNIGVKNKGFLSLNRGRNNRPAVVPLAKVDAEMLTSEDFTFIDNPGAGISTYWADGNNKNSRDSAESKFFFGFAFEGKDPYHIVLRTSYARNYTYIEKNEDGDKAFVYKWFKGAVLMTKTTGNAYLSSDAHIRYKTKYVEGEPNTQSPVSDDKPGYFHGNECTWGTVALLNNTSGTGYVLLGTRTVDGNGAVPTPSNNKYNYVKFSGNNNINFVSLTAADATKDNTIEGIYPIKKVTYKIVTPFYKVSATTDHVVTAVTYVSQYTVEKEDLAVKFLPASLRRKYCNFTGRFYSDAACTNEITKFSDVTYDDGGDGYTIYVGYELTSTIPFEAITPAATYSAATWQQATWYELTDEGSEQAEGLKLRYDGTNFKNNGAAGVYEKESEFAFIGDPYEMQVVYRNATSGATPYYVGAAGMPLSDATLLTAATSATEGYIWEIPEDDPATGFRLHQYKGSGDWYWNTGHPSPVAVDYSTASHTYNVASANAQTVTFQVSNLTAGEDNYLVVTVGGTNADQATVQSGTIYVDGTNATFTVAIKARGDGDKQFTLSIQEKNGEDNSDINGPSVITVNQNVSTFTANTVQYNRSNATRIKVMELPKHDFTYNIVDKAGNIAVKATAKQTIFSPLSLASVPSIIISPYLAGETVTFYTSYPSKGRGNLSGEITELTAGNAASCTNIYVKYTTTAMNAKPIKLTEDEEFNVRLFGYYIYYDAGTIKTKASPSDGELKSNAYLWKLRNRDPYAMLIDNLGARDALSVSGTEQVDVFDDDGTAESPKPYREKGAWVALATSVGNDVTLVFDEDRGDAQRFIAKRSLQDGVYEVMVADGGDASTTYYNIGCPAENTVKIYSNATYHHGSDTLRFVLVQNVDYQYHLIDKAKHELFVVPNKTPDLALPAEYQSPLVGKYHFYDKSNINIAGTIYDTIPGAKELSSISDLYAVYSNPETITAEQYTAGEGTKKSADNEATMLAEAKKLTATGWYFYNINNGTSYMKFEVTRGYRGLDIYVMYDINDVVNFNKGQYMIRFLDPLAEGYYLEDGNDKLTGTKLKAVYPYCNGDGNLNVYDNDMQKEQFGGGASTRPRWVWYFDSENNDPYHVRVRSKSTITYKNIKHPTYLTTYAVKFNQDGEADPKHIVTGGTLPGIASAMPTEYMVLGSVGHYRLLTTDSIDDGVEKKRCLVDALEQYWKTYNMIKLHVLGISSTTDAYSEDESTWVVPADPASYRETVVAKGWHSYSTYANATRWNGYNDKSNGHEKKVVENLEHWFQTFKMGNGTFDIEDAEIPPVLVLLDRHGWEVMRRPLPPSATYPQGEELAALRVYDSPLVDQYYFYSNATKASGCHKYTLRMQDGKERDQITVNGERFSSSSLANLPPRSAKGVVSDGEIQDLYVTYSVKEEYEHNYLYNLNMSSSPYVESGSSQPYMVLQNGRFYKTENSGTARKDSYISKPIYEHAGKDDSENGNIYDLIVSPREHGSNDNILNAEGKFRGNIFWYIKPNLDIDTEMGIPWTKVTGVADAAQAKDTLRKEYKDKMGFDPYNMQLQLVNKNDGTPDGRFLTTHMDTAVLNNGIMIGSYPLTADSTMVTIAASGAATIDGEGYDHTTLRITNQTFMAVSDVNGNMQLMPRFDHTRRVSLDKVNPWLSQLYAPEDHAKANLEDNNSMGRQTTFFICPKRFHYHIIDNNGREALGYERGADFYPEITEHFKSPIAKDFTYYSGLAEPNDSVTCTPGEWNAATGEFKRTLTKETMYADAVKLLPRAGTYYYRIGTRGNFIWRKVTVAAGNSLTDKQITSSFAEANEGGIYDDVECQVYVRYDYDLDADMDADHILQGQWYSVNLNSLDLQAYGTIVINDNPETDGVDESGTGVGLFTGSKPDPIGAEQKQWQWKFLAAPTDPSSDYYVEPDPYAVQLFNRNANYTKNPSEEPSPMAVGIKVKNDAGRPDRFVLLSHPNGGYALAVAKEYTNYRYQFVSGKDMTAPDAGTPVAADTAYEAGFTYKVGAISEYAQLVLNNDVKHLFTYRVITNDSLKAITVTQTEAEAQTHRFAPYLPDTAQSPLLNLEDYTYYGFARPGSTSSKFGVIEQTKLYTLSGLYDDTVYVRYAAYDMDKTSFKVPNKKTVVDGKVARDENSVDVSMNINGGLPYNIIWYSDTTMKSTDKTTVEYEKNKDLSGDEAYVWYFSGGDPYALKIRHTKTGKYLNGTSTMVEEGSAPTFMLLRKPDYDYGILQKTGLNDILTGYGQTTTTGAPTKYIIFGLSIHNLIYRLVIANTGSYVAIPYRATKAGEEYAEKSTWEATDTIHVKGTTQRDLTTAASGLAGDKYQLGSTLTWNKTQHTYSHDAGSVSIGDALVLPNDFARPNCTFEFYIEGIYHHSENAEVDDTPYAELDNKYKGLKLDKLMPDEDLIGQNVVVNVVYSFDRSLATNTGLDFVTDTAQNLWYTYETYDGTTPYLAQYTNAWGLQSKQGFATHYTNDYLWTPLGDVYGFKMYNRYMLKNTTDGKDKVMMVKAFAANDTLRLAEPGKGGYTAGYEIFELVNGDVAGYFRVHPVANDGATKYYVRRDPADNYTKLSTSPCDWRFGLDRAMLTPYYEAAGYVGGLTAEGKTLYEAAEASGKITNIQKVVYDDANIVHYTPGYYRLHNQPGVSGIEPVRYASGYLHAIEKTEVSGGIPMHFYSRSGVHATFAGKEDGLGTGFTETHATWGEIPIDSTEIDPSTIFYFSGTETLDRNARSTIQTQGLYVAANANGDVSNGTGNSKQQRAVMTDNSANAITFSIMDIGGAVLLIHDGANADVRRYLNFEQTKADSIYDLKYYHNVPTDDAKWCMQPVQKTVTAGDGEMPLQIPTNNGGDGYYYATFYAPFDVLLPSDHGDSTYNAYTCSQWYDEAIHPTAVPAVSTYAEGKFVPAGTPVIIRVKDESGILTLTLPSTAPSTPLSCVFKGQYLEKLLDVDKDHDVYTLGVPMISKVDKDEDYDTTGDITAPLPDFAANGVGFYINATRNKEDDPLQALWHRNNRYVLHNKIYYRAGDRAEAPAHRSGTEYVPVIFGDEDPEQPDDQNSSTGWMRQSQKILYNGQLLILHDGKVYTITGQEVR